MTARHMSQNFAPSSLPIYSCFEGEVLYLTKLLKLERKGKSRSPEIADFCPCCSRTCAGHTEGVVAKYQSRTLGFSGHSVPIHSCRTGKSSIRLGRSKIEASPSWRSKLKETEKEVTPNGVLKVLRALLEGTARWHKVQERVFCGKTASGQPESVT